MNEHDEIDPSGDHDPVLSAAGAELRHDARPVTADAVEAAVWRRRTRSLGVVTAAAVAVVALLGGVLVIGDNDRSGELAADRAGAPTSGDVEQLLGSLDDRPVDPTTVQLVGTVSTFASCDALMGDLRQVGAEHVGSRGFGGYGYVGDGYVAVSAFDESAGPRMMSEDSASAQSDSGDSGAAPDTSGTLGTNVQVAGVDEPDVVKAEGNLIYDLDGRGNLRITDAGDLTVLSTLDVTAGGGDASGGDASGGDSAGFGTSDSRFGSGGLSAVDELLVANARVAIFGSEAELSAPIDGDPSATQASTTFMTVTMVDATDPVAPQVTDRVRIEGSLVSARLVGDQIRMVTTSNMADLGFVMPTTPNSVAKALEQNRRSVASSTAADWIPDWQRAGAEPEPLVPCERVYVPDTFAGVAMTSMVTVGLAGGRFDPAGTSILAPATTLYAGVDVVAVSSEVWVDSIDRDRLEFDDWRTAIHEFRFADATAPSYVGSGIVEGSTIGQFAFGEVGGSVAVVTTIGSPWRQDPSTGIDLTVLTPNGDGELDATASVTDLADGNGVVSAVRFVGDRVLVSTGVFDQRVVVIDVADPAAPRRAGSVTLAGTVAYLHPLPDGEALAIGARYDEVGEGFDRQSRSWVEVQLLDVSDADAPVVVGTWQRPWVSDSLGWDHRAFTWWPERRLAMWGLRSTGPGFTDLVNEAAVLSVDGAVTEVALPQASRPPEVPAPCPVVDVTDPEAQSLVGTGGVVLRCEPGADGVPGLDGTGGGIYGGAIDWPGYQCYPVDEFTVSRFVPDDDGGGVYLVCSPAPNPVVGRVLVVAGVPILYTDQTLEALDPASFASTAIAYHPSGGWFG